MEQRQHHFYAFFFIVIFCFVYCSHHCQGYIIKEDETFLQNPTYHTQNELEDMFARLQKIFPQHARVQTIGQSLEGRNLLVLHIGENVQRPRNILKPIVKYVGNMHGDETIGRQLLIYLAQYLLFNYDTNLKVGQLVNTTEIYLMPTMNPDGFARSQEGKCDSLPNYIGRTNAAGIDLNRDFPDRLESQQTIEYRSQFRQPETSALVSWILSKPFVLSANFHGGAVVASYPYDNSIAHRECCVESLTPDDGVFKLMAHTYSDNHPIMSTGKNCNDTFANGVTNGAYWYELNGGMQDFNYAFSNCFELTIELSCCKYPLAETLPSEWAKNKQSLLKLLKLAQIGVKGIIKDASGYPIKDASVIISGLEDKPMKTTERGEYWRLLTPGIYDIQAIAFGYQPSPPQKIHVKDDQVEALRMDIVLSTIDNNYDGSSSYYGGFRKLITERENAKIAGGFLTTTKFEHHNFTHMEKFLREINEMYPTITRLYSIGKSVQQRDLWVMEISAKTGSHIPGVPEFKYVANMHGNEVVGKEMLLLLTKYICEHYLEDTRITALVNTTRMHFLYSMNPDGYEISKEGDRSSSIGRPNANGVDLNRNFPDQYGTDEHNRVTEPEVAAVMKWILSEPFVLSANLHGGALVANYPFDDNENDFKNLFNKMRSNNVKGKLNPTEDNELFKHLASIYSHAHPTMHLGKPCPLFKNEVFTDGIVNGAQWYSVTGGMQDWNYVHGSVMEITIEMGCDKFPMAADLPMYWEDNREPLIRFIEQVHTGVHGFIKSSIGTPVAGANIHIDNNKHATFSGTYGDYWKLTLPGRHNVTILADGFTPDREEVELPNDNNRSIRLDITLMRDDPQHWSSANDFRIIQNVVGTRYHTNAQLKEQMADLETKAGQIATFAYANNEFGFYFSSIKLTADIGEPEESKYKILILSSFYDGTSAMSREISMNLARHIVEGYTIRDPYIMHLLENSVLYIIPMMENFEMAFTMYNRNTSLCNPMIGNHFATRLLNNESEKSRDVFLRFMKSENFDLMLTFTGGSFQLSYPKENGIYEKFANTIEKTEFGSSPMKCSQTSTLSMEHDETERLTNFFYKMYKIPMFTLGLDCCRMPQQIGIGSIWRKNIEKIKNFMHLIDTGVVGYVQTSGGEPIRYAQVRIVDYNLLYNVTKNEARFQIILPSGEFTLEVSAPNYETKQQVIAIKQGLITNLNAIQLNKYQLITGVSEIKQLGNNQLVSQQTTATTSNTTTATTTTIISGFVLDLSNHPIKNAKITVVTPKYEHLRNYTDSLGAYTLKQVPSGDITLKVEAPHHDEATRNIYVSSVGAPVNGVVFRLKYNDHILGMPRLLFIIFASILLIICVVIAIMCAQFLLARQQRPDKRYYNFSLLPQKDRYNAKELFADEIEGEDGETELFRSPIKKGMKIQPYYDDQHMNDGAGDDDDEEEELVFHDDESGDEIVMLEKRRH